MSDAKTKKKAETVSKKDAGTKTETTNNESKSVDNSATKSVSSPKSASQANISHFSSVSTPQYRSGWNNIFGGVNDVEKTLPEEARENDFPKNLELLDDEIGVILRNILDEAFVDVAKKQGINLNGSNRSVCFKYIINCEIKEE